MVEKSIEPLPENHRENSRKVGEVYESSILPSESP